jgi:hypothetical protein
MIPAAMGSGEQGAGPDADPLATASPVLCDVGLLPAPCCSLPVVTALFFPPYPPILPHAQRTHAT